MTHLLTNVTKFYTKLSEFRENGQFTDVTIECEDGAGFRCHRLVLAAASDYFSTMFCSSFRERSSESIVLGEVNAATFQEVLRFIYTGDAVVDYVNVYDVLRASDFFHLSDLQDLCVSFVRRNQTGFTVPDFLNIYLYACATKMEVLTDDLKPHLVNQFEVFSKADEFLEMSFDLLKMLVISRLATSSTPRNAHEIVLGAITRWVCHRRGERLQYVSQLVKLIRFENVCSEFMRVMITNLFADADVAVLPRFTSSVGLAKVPDLQRTSVLYVYVKYAHENLIRIFCIDSAQNYSLCGAIFDGDISDHQFCVVALDDFFLYRLNYFGGGNDKNATEADAKERTFYVHTSADMSASFPLKRPPIVFEEVSLCAMRNNIYAYNKGLYQSVIRTDSTSNTFEDEEIARGMYTYNCEVDDWFAVPEMKKKLEYSSVTVLDDILYAIGGNASTVVEPMKYVQAYDHRVAEWWELPRTRNDYVGAACCVREDKIYVCGGLQTKGCERYDPVAGKWESIFSLANSKSMSHHAIAYSTHIWLFDRSPIPEDGGADSFSNFQISDRMFDQQQGRWTVGWRVCSPASGEFLNEIPTRPTNIVDCVVFEKL